MVSGTLARGVNTYQKTAVDTSSPVELVLMLYDGALRFIAEARAAIAARDVAAKGRAISRAIAIVGELQATLDFERGGQIAASLNELYAFVLDRLLAASLKQDAQPLDEAVRVLSNLRAGWAEIADAAR